MEIKLDADAVKELASAAIFKSLSQESRDNAIQQAIQYLMTPEKNQNYSGVTKTPLQAAFEQAIYAAARNVIADKIENDPAINASIYAMLGPLITPALEVESEVYNSGLADALGTALGFYLADEARKRGSNR